MKRLLIEAQEDRLAIALVNDKRLTAFCHDAPAGPLAAENIYLGVVDRIVKGIEAAFVRLGKDAMGFLPFAECPVRPHSGDRLLVQIKRPPIGEKDAYLTCDVTLAGRYCLLAPMSRGVAYSKRMTAEERARMKPLAQAICPPGMGVIMRNESVAAQEEDVTAEADRLKAEWERLLETAAAGCEPRLLRARDSELTHLMRNERGAIEEALTNAPEACAGLPMPVRYAQSPFALYHVRAQLEKSFRRKVWLDCGGFLVVDRTEALTVIDVNSGKFTGGKTGTEATFLKLNREAAQEIARLMRLRRMGGIILVDFVDMQQPASREAVLAAMQEALADDPVKTVVHGFTSLGLMELTRKKTEDAFAPLTLCPCCHGTGLNEEKITC